MWLLTQTVGPRLPAPPGLPSGLTPAISPLSCLLPIGMIGAALLVVEGVRRVIFPE